MRRWAAGRWRSVPPPAVGLQVWRGAPLQESVGECGDGGDDLGEAVGQVCAVGAQAGAAGPVGAGPGVCEFADSGAERPQLDAAVGGGGKQCEAGLPEVQRVGAGEVVQVDVVADAGVGFAELHRGADFSARTAAMGWPRISTARRAGSRVGPTVSGLMCPMTRNCAPVRDA